MDIFIKYIIPILVGGFIGWFTNYLAIKMLFRPYKEIRVFGIKLPFTPGLIPKEKERIAMLSLTRGDVFRALFLAKQITRDDIRALIKNNELISEAQRELALIDFDEALNFYRGNTLIDTLGLALGISSEQLDKFLIQTITQFYCLKMRFNNDIYSQRRRHRF